MNVKAGINRCAGMLVLCTLLLTSTCLASDHGYNIWFAGEVLGVDLRAGTVTIARGPTETSSPAVISCILVKRVLKHLRRGMHVKVEADTRIEPWHIIQLRPLEFRIRPVLHTFSFAYSVGKKRRLPFLPA